MYSFQIETPKNLEQALELKWKYGKEIHCLAGGTDLLVSIKNKRFDWGERPRLINLGQLDELTFIKDAGENIEIGPNTTHAALINNSMITEFIPTLSKSLSYVGSPQIRNLGTIGGNICHASPAADSLPTLYARNAQIEVSTRKKRETIPIDQFITGPGHTSIDPQGIVTKIIVPKLKGYTGDYMTLRQRKSLSVVVVSVATEILVQNNEIEDIRIALGAVAPTVLRGKKTETYLRGKSIDKGLIDKAGDLIAEECVPIDDVRSNRVYRKAMTSVLLKRFLHTFYE
ncbi:MAG: FAD binding domain-containing protein [Candidatus Hodarchaeales archaeon]